MQDGAGVKLPAQAIRLLAVYRWQMVASEILMKWCSSKIIYLFLHVNWYEADASADGTDVAYQRKPSGELAASAEPRLMVAESLRTSDSFHGR